jgi:hypothetical protein
MSGSRQYGLSFSAHDASESHMTTYFYRILRPSSFAQVPEILFCLFSQIILVIGNVRRQFPGRAVYFVAAGRRTPVLHRLGMSNGGGGGGGSRLRQSGTLTRGMTAGSPYYGG